MLSHHGDCIWNTFSNKALTIAILASFNYPHKVQAALKDEIHSALDELVHQRGDGEKDEMKEGEK